MNALKQWIASLESRDRKAMWLGVLSLLVIGGYFGVIEPLAKQRKALSDRVAEQERGVAWMTSAAASLAARPQTARRAAADDRDGQSLLALVDETVRSHGLTDALQRGEPDPSGDVRLWFENVSFNALIDWLVALDVNYSVGIGEFSAERTPEPGTVNARVTVKDG